MKRMKYLLAICFFLSFAFCKEVERNPQVNEPENNIDEDSLVAEITLPYYYNKVSRSLWVSPTGDDNGAGTKGAPFKSIQAAVNQATPGTAILVKEGVYEGSVVLDGKHGTHGAPILLISVDGIGKARINGTKHKAAISGWKCSYVGVYGFHVHSQCPQPANDEGGFKLGGDYAVENNLIRNLVIAGNYITGEGRDGFKLFGGARNNLIIGNTIEGTWEQEALDNVGIENVIYAYNTILGKANYTGITMKHGSRNVEVFRNDFALNTGWCIVIGGQGTSPCHADWGEYWNGFEAKNINVHHNITRLSGGTSVVFEGANNCVAANNYLATIVNSIKSFKNEGTCDSVTYNSFDNKILNNIVTREDFFRPSDPTQTEGYVIEGNTIGTIDDGPAAGADQPEAQNFLEILYQVAK